MMSWLCRHPVCRYLLSSEGPENKANIYLMAFHEVFIWLSHTFYEMIQVSPRFVCSCRGLGSITIGDPKDPREFSLCRLPVPWANVLLVVQWPKWRCFVMLTVLLQEIRALVKCIFFQIKKCGSSLKKSIMCSCHLFRKTQVIPIQRIGFILIGNLAAILLALMYRAMSKWKFRACLYLILVYIYLYTVYIFRSL